MTDNGILIEQTRRHIEIRRAFASEEDPLDGMKERLVAILITAI